MALLGLVGSLAAVGRRVAPGGTASRWERGQGVVEYGIVLGLAALLAVVILVVFGDQVADIVQWIGRTVDATTGGR